MLGLDDHAFKFALPLVLFDFCLFYYWYANWEDTRAVQLAIALFGEFWCVIAMWVEVKIAKTYPDFDHESPPDMKKYKPFCDFASWGTCSKVLMSPPGRLLRVLHIAKKPGGTGIVDKIRGWLDYPNPVLGILYFALHLVYPLFTLPFFRNFPVFGPYIGLLAFAISAAVGLMPFYLGYQLFFVLKDFCIVCVSQYIAIFALVPLSYNIFVANAATMDWFPCEAVGPLSASAVTCCFLALGAVDAIIAAADIVVWLGSPAHSREVAVEDEKCVSRSDYVRLV